MNTTEQILFLLKMRGPLSAQQVAGLTGLTSMGARRQLEAAQDKGLLLTEEVADKVGRPARRWRLSDAGHARFPDRHADLTVDLISQLRTLFGPAALDTLIAAREKTSEAYYRSVLGDGSDGGDWRKKVAGLALLRDAEGYMADIEQQDDGSVLLLENHCPICAAARTCQDFCRSELAIFQRVLGDDCSVQRTEHVLEGSRRCVYRIVPIN